MAKLSDALYEAAINGVVIFALSTGLQIVAKTSGALNADASYTFILVQSAGLALLRFATYMMQEDERISAGGIEEYIGTSKNVQMWPRLTSFCSRHQVGKLI